MAAVLALGFAGLAPHAALAAASSSGAKAAPGCAAAWYHPITPARAYDSGAGGVAQKPIKVSLTKLLPTGACAVVATVTAAGATDATTATVSALGASTSAPASLDLAPGRTASDEVTVGVSGKPAVDVVVGQGKAQLQLDVAGYFSATAGDAFAPSSPTRRLDTGSGLGTTATSIGPSGTVTVTPTTLGIPADAAAVVLDLTAVGGTVETEVSAYAAGTSRPTVDDLAVAAQDTRTGLATVPVAAGGVTFFNSAGSIRLIADVVGWYSATATGSLFTSAAATATATLGPGASTDVQATSTATPAATVLTLTASGATTATTVSAFPTPASGSSVPTVTTLSVDAGATTPDLVVVATSPSGQIRLHNASGSVSLRLAYAGYFTARPAGNDVSFNQCSGSGTTTTLPPAASLGIINPTAGGLASTSPASCLGALESWARSTGSEQFYLPLVDFGSQSALWRSPVADAPQHVTCSAPTSSSTPGCAYDYGWGQAEDALVAAGSDGASRAWWLDIEPGDSLWSVCTSRSPASGCTAQSPSQNAEVIAGALAYLRAQVPAQGLYSAAAAWTQLVGTATVGGEPGFSTYAEWYATGALTRAQQVGACTTPFAGGAVALVQSIAPAPGESNSALDYDQHC